MSTNFASYFVLGFILFLAGALIFAYKKQRLIKLFTKQAFQSKLAPVILLVTVIPFFLITLALLINDSFTLTKKEYLTSKVGISDGIIYSRLPNDVWNQEKVASLQSLVRDDFDSTLPILYKLQPVQALNSHEAKDSVLLLSFNPNTAYSYDPDLLKQDINFSLQDNEAIISKSLADSLKIIEGEKFKAGESEFIIKRIVSDNGLIGFNLPLSTKYTVPEGSIYLKQSSLAKHTGVSGESYNGILVARSARYDKDLLQNGIQSKLYAQEKNILFDEIKDTTFTGLDNGEKVNFGQTLLLVSILPLVTCIGVIILLWQLVSLAERKVYALLRYSGFTKGDLNSFVFFQNLIYITCSGIFGTILGILVYPFLVNTIKNSIFTDYNKFNFQSILTPRIDTQSIIFAFTGTWLILSLLNLLWSAQKSQTIVSNILKNRIQAKIQIWSTKILLRLLGGIVFVFGFVYFVFKSSFTNTIAKTATVVMSIAVITWILGYGLQFKYRRQKVFTFTAIISMFVIFLLKHVFSTKNLFSNSKVFSVGEIILYLIGITAIIVLNMPFIGALVGKLFEPFSGFRKRVALSIALSGLSFATGFFTILITVLVLLLVSLGTVLNTYLNSLARDNYINGFDGTIIDNAGITPVQQILSNGDVKILSLEKISYATATIPQYKYNDLEGFNSDDSNHKKDDVYQTQISVLSQAVLSAQKIDSDIQNVASTFSSSSEYILLGRNFFQASSKDNVRPGLKKGDIISMELPGKFKIERKIAGIIESVNTEGDFDPSLFLNNGIILSENDYKNLQERENIFFPTVYGFNLPNREASESNRLKIHHALVNSGISNISYKEREIQKSIKTRELITKIITVYGVLSGILLLLIQSFYLAKQLLFSFKNQNSLFKSYALGSFINVFVGSVLGLVSLIFIDKYFSHYELQWKLLLIVAAGLCVLSLIFIIITTRILTLKK